MNTLNFRAQLIGPGADTYERPQIKFASAKQPLEEWATGILSGLPADLPPGSAVIIYETAERAVARIEPPNKEATAK